MTRRMPLSRRTFLRGAGAALALPLLDAMAPLRAFADDGPPVRLAFLFAPNGANMSAWTPATTGTLGKLSPTLLPLTAVKDEVLVLSGLAIDGGRAHGDGPGDHARSAGSYLTCAHPKKTGGADIRAGVSVDQVAARHLANHTRFASVELGCERSALAGNCDSGYSCAYSSNVSWRTPSTPMAKEIDPRKVFDRLFLDLRPGETPEAARRRAKRRRSVLDLVGDDAKALRKRLGGADRGKLDEYLDAVREVETRIERAEVAGKRDLAGQARPDGIPAKHADHARLLGDLIVTAFRTDTTRVATFMLGNAGSNRRYASLGAREGHHALSHHGGDAKKRELIARIDRFNVELLAHVVGRLREVKEGDGTLLDNCAIVYGSGLGDGNRHNHDELPFLVAGRAGGHVRPGRHVRHPHNTPAANLYLSMLHAAGVPAERFADSTGTLSELR